ncbi:MAG: phosphoribosyl-AMP cyclohydrolase [Thermomicrobiales bacterium]
MTSKLAIDFDRHPLIPAVIVDFTTGDVLMVAFMNEEAYRLTRETGRTHFWSRSRNALWKKGETSGHEQVVHRMSINCEDNALLIAVDQLGAVCHTGHPTCFYRDIEENEELTVTTDRVFDPEIVYGGKLDSTRLWYGALAWLKDQPLEDQSSTSRMLRTPDAPIATRVVDELRELAGVLDGSHVHRGITDDVMTEGSQSLYWLALAGIQQGYSWEDIRPDRALDSAEPGVAPATASTLLLAAARNWEMANWRTSPDSIHETISLVAQAARSSGIEPQALIEHDLEEMQSREYLRPWFERP